MICPKCKAKSGDDWSQCGGDCPMPMSPHHKPAKEAKDLRDALKAYLRAVGEAEGVLFIGHIIDERLRTIVENVRDEMDRNNLPWSEKLNAEVKRLGRPMTLDELLALAKTHSMTPEEIEAQSQSWARQDMD